MIASSYYDNNTICICNLGPANKQQVAYFLKCYLNRYWESTGIEVQGEWRINLITNNHNEPTGIAYIYFSNPQMYHIFLGNNLDGSRRVTQVPNPIYEEINELDHESIELKDIDLHIPAFIEVPYEDLFTPPIIELEDYQIENTNHDHIVEPDISPCLVRKTNYTSNVLVCDKAPHFITEHCLRDVFNFYVKDKEDLEKGYPLIQLENRGKTIAIEVTYPPGKIDAIFALVMIRKVKLLYRERMYVLLFKYK